MMNYGITINKSRAPSRATKRAYIVMLKGLCLRNNCTLVEYVFEYGPSTGYLHVHAVVNCDISVMPTYGRYGYQVDIQPIYNLNGWIHYIRKGKVEEGVNK